MAGRRRRRRRREVGNRRCELAELTELGWVWWELEGLVYYGEEV